MKVLLKYYKNINSILSAAITTRPVYLRQSIKKKKGKNDR